MLVLGVVVAALAACGVHAQVSVRGLHTPALPAQLARASAFALHPRQDNDQLLALDALQDSLARLENPRISGAEQRPHVFAVPVRSFLAASRPDADVVDKLDFVESAERIALDDGSVLLRMRVESPDARALSFGFKRWAIEQGMEFYVYNDQMTLGAYTHANIKPDSGRFTVQPLVGTYGILELFIPSHLLSVRSLDSLLSQVTMELDTVSHAFRDPYAILASGSCNVDVTCRQSGYETLVRSVGMLLTRSGSAYCSGSMINSDTVPARQLFLTAYHCTAASDSVVLFNYQRPSCNSGTAPRTTSAAGLKPLASSAASDFYLGEILETIPRAYEVHLAGFSFAAAPATSVVGIHHPSGDVKKISFYNATVSPDCWDECPARNHWRILAWTTGTTEPGSSGSPLFDAVSKRIVGQLHGGTASCSNVKGWDSYGAVFASWTKGLDKILDPSGVLGRTGVLGLDGRDL